MISRFRHNSAIWPGNSARAPRLRSGGGAAIRPSRGARRAVVAALLGIALAGGSFCGPTTAFAGRNPNTKMILHLVPFSNRSTCLNGRLEKPEQAITKGDIFPAKYIAYVLVVDGTPGVGVAGCQFGIAYNDTTGRGVDILDWTECSLFNWPEPGWPDAVTGNLLTWNQETDCDTTGMRVVGYFTVTAHSPDRLRLIARPADGRAAVIACGVTNIDKDSDTIDTIAQDNLGFVDFGGGPGYNPWNPLENLSRLKNPGLKPRVGPSGSTTSRPSGSSDEKPKKKP